MNKLQKIGVWGTGLLITAASALAQETTPVEDIVDGISDQAESAAGAVATGAVALVVAIATVKLVPHVGRYLYGVAKSWLGRS